MKNFYIFRHGLATHSKTGYGDKVVTAEILPEAIPITQRMGTFLRNIPSDVNISSEFIRCRQTVAIISSATGKEFVFDKRLNEYAPEIDESFEAFSQRVKEFLKDLKTIPDANILICTHGAIIAALKNLIVKNNFSLLAQFDYPKTGVLVIIRGKKIEEKDFNQPSKL